MPKGDLGRRIGTLITERGLKKAGVARQLGISPQKLGNWTAGANDPPHERIPDIARALEVPIEHLYTPHLVDATSRLISTKSQMVRDHGEVPGSGPPPTPARWMEVHSDLNLENALVVTVASEIYGDRFPQGRILVFRPTPQPMPGKYHLMQTEGGERYLALVDNRGKVRPLTPTRTKPTDTPLGVLVQEFATNEQGIGP